MGCTSSKDTTATTKSQTKMSTAPPVFKFGSGLRDCVATNPESYKVVAETPNARLVEMRVPAGGEDQPHDHPAHSMFFAKPAKLSITDYGPDGKPAGEPHVVEIPAGASPIFPAGAHQARHHHDRPIVPFLFVSVPHGRFTTGPRRQNDVKGREKKRHRSGHDVDARD